MSIRHQLSLAIALLIVALALPVGAMNTGSNTPTGEPVAAIDLATEEGARLVRGQWRYSDTRIIEVDFKAPGPDKQPTGAPIKTYDYTPHAGGADFDDSRWEVIAPTTLDQRRASGRLCFNWYPIQITAPQRAGGFDPTRT